VAVDSGKFGNMSLLKYGFILGLLGFYKYELMSCFENKEYFCKRRNTPIFSTVKLNLKKSKSFGGKIPGFSGAGSAKQLELLKQIDQKKRKEADEAPDVIKVQTKQDELSQGQSTQKVSPNSNWRSGTSSSPTVEESSVPASSIYNEFDKMLGNMASFTDSKEAYIEAMEESAASRVLQSKSGGNTATPVQLALSEGDFAPLDVWGSLKDTQEKSVRFGDFCKGNDLVVVLADARKGSSDLKTALVELNARFPKSAASLVVVTADLPHENRKLVKKSNLFFPVLADSDKTWLKAYQVVNSRRLEKMVFIIEPNLGKILVVLKDVDSTAICEIMKDALEVAHKKNAFWSGRSQI